MKKSLLTLLMVVFIDASGLGILFPILNDLLINPYSGFLSFSLSIESRHWLYSLVIFTFFFSWFLGATFISKASDQIGRKKSLLICLYGIFIGYLLTIFSIFFSSVTLLVIGRIIGGFTAGSQPVAQASIIDISTPKNKAKNLGLVMLSFSLGLICGPIIGGILSDSNILPIFNDSSPFYVILILTIINIVLIKVFFHEPEIKSAKFKFKLIELLSQFVLAFKIKKVFRLSIVFFIMQLSFNTFYIFISVYLLERYQYNTFMNSMVMLVLGLSMSMSAGFLIGPLTRRFNHHKIISCGLLIMALSTLALIATDHTWVPFIIAIPFMIAYGASYTSMLTLFSDSVNENKQGWVMGITVSLFTFGSAITSIFGGKLMDIAISAPFILAIIGFIISAIFIMFFYYQKLK